MSFNRKLKQMVEKLGSEAERNLERNLDLIAREIAAVLKSGRWRGVLAPRAIEKKMERFAQDAWHAANNLDVAEFVSERVLRRKDAKVVDLVAHNDLRRLQSEILDMFASGKAPRRGFVYVAWRQRPENYFYVGKASSEKRLNLPGHGKLVSASRDATRLSLVFPSRSTGSIIGHLEGSLIRLIDAQTGRRPKLNDVQPAFPSGRGVKRINDLGDFLSLSEDYARDPRKRRKRAK